ncbi:hypothetical protein PCASD_25375 [Puccinia coronata f. sp. avenae]|uniref:Uncharacterized protein n=1 Tax=Puccinia coronata f. sp. avenae TaxID=200324 RepID=A0A2N5TPK1_9BASI|nr:hypothetical protein PCASD_25375 [Puccinia coronata f. sp. avenae]
MEELLSRIVGWGLNAKSDLTSVLLLQVSVRLWSTTSDQFPASQSKSINLPAASASQPAPFYFNLLPKRALSKATGNISTSTSNHLSNQQTPAHPPQAPSCSKIQITQSAAQVLVNLLHFTSTYRLSTLSLFGSTLPAFTSQPSTGLSQPFPQTSDKPPAAPKSESLNLPAASTSPP